MTLMNSCIWSHSTASNSSSQCVEMHEPAPKGFSSFGHLLSAMHVCAALKSSMKSDVSAVMHTLCPSLPHAHKSAAALQSSSVAHASPVAAVAPARVDEHLCVVGSAQLEWHRSPSDASCPSASENCPTHTGGVAAPLHSPYAHCPSSAAEHGPPSCDCLKHLPSRLQNRPAAHELSAPKLHAPPSPTVPTHTPPVHLPSLQSACVSHLPPS
mmetsp:Transcript_17813/g.62834  ORF Transcript_17813/g.62834 Transcript_17813/m.62834 type:complete len:212 (+) Transcript_17813:331-966(+)